MRQSRWCWSCGRSFACGKGKWQRRQVGKSSKNVVKIPEMGEGNGKANVDGFDLATRHDLNV